MSIFSKIPVRKPRLTPHDLSHNVEFSTEFGRLSPVNFEKVVPGDIIPIGIQHQEQFAPLASKLYHEFRIKTETFFVPTRLLWDNFGKFFVEEENTYVHPQFTLNQFCDVYLQRLQIYMPNLKPSSSPTLLNILGQLLFNMFGSDGIFHYLYGDFYGTLDRSGLRNEFVTAVSSSGGLWHFSIGVKALPSANKPFDLLRLAAYVRVLSEYYLDENLFDELVELGTELGSNVNNLQSYLRDVCDWFVKYSMLLLGMSSTTTGTDFLNHYSSNPNLFKCFVFRNFPKDYFAGALPFKQDGSAVEIPLQGDGPLSLQMSDTAVTYLTNNSATSNVSVAVAGDQSGVPAGFKRVYLDFQSSKNGVNFDNEITEPLQVSATVSGLHTTIEDFRTAYQLQEWKEKNARGGTRYKEQIFSHFGVRSKDSRLDRPEFIVGSTDGVNYGNVFTTNQDTKGDGVPAESITAVSGGGRSRVGVYKVTEHGYIITLYSIYPKASYAYGLYRQAMELDKFDYFWPEFQHLGEQEVFYTELDGAAEEGVFGYQPRYAQYKCRMDQVHGEFVDSLVTFTDYRQFVKTPVLNPAFISIVPQFNGFDRIFNYVNSDFQKIYVYLRINMPALRPIDYYGVPRLFI